MTVGDRIKARLEELNQDVKWLHRKTGIPASSLYEIMNGRIHSTPRLPTIAAALGLRALWLEKKSGPRLIADADAMAPAEGGWPFGFSQSRWEQLQPGQKLFIENEVERLVRAYEAGHPTSGPQGDPPATSKGLRSGIIEDRISGTKKSPRKHSR